MAAKLEFFKHTTFKGLFNEEIAKEVLLHYWSVIKSGLSILDLMKIKPEYIYREMGKNNPKMQSAMKLKLLGMKTLIDSIGELGAKS